MQECVWGGLADRFLAFDGDLGEVEIYSATEATTTWKSHQGKAQRVKAIKVKRVLI